MRFGLAKAALAGATVAVTVAGVIAAIPGAAHASTSPVKSGWSSRLSTAQVSRLSADANQRVIVLLRNQHSNLAGSSTHALAMRADAYAADRSPIVAQLRQLHAPRIVTFNSLNAIATTVSSAEEANLRANPAVLAVDPDSAVTGPSTNADLLPAGYKVSTNGARSNTHAAPGKTVTGSDLCGSASAPLLEPEALHLIQADNRTDANAPMNSGPLSAHSLGYTGAGVNIAVFPEGMDPQNPDFIRNGQSVVTDYEDFTGEGTSAKTPGGEAFGDVSSLVAQANNVYDLNQEVNPAFGTGGPACDVKVLGVAPGATVDVMKVFGESNDSFTSVIIQGIDWAITTDHANILSISIGFFAEPSSAAEQPLTQILENAIADGTVVVASTGDASPSNTEESPALDPGVIGAAASTSYRIFAQTNFFLYDMAEAVHSDASSAAYPLGQSTPGWLDDQVSTLSSSGVTEDGRVPDILAPGDLNWAVCSTDVTTYTDCANPMGGSDIGIYDFGGTSESAPLTAGVAALVIQAYREAHANTTPSAAIVRQILLNSATDIGVAADEQGAGLLNALRAVQLAKAYGGTSATGHLLHMPALISDLGPVGASHTHTITVTNNGASAALVVPVLRWLGPAHTLASGSMSLYEYTSGLAGTCAAGIDKAEYYNGETIPELDCKSFVVPPGVDQLDSRIAWNPFEPCSGCTAGAPTAREILIDPDGRYAQYSDPQGDGAGFADAQVHQPLAGTWTLLVFGRATSNYEGPVSYSETAETFQYTHADFSPQSQVIGAGKSANYTFTLKAPTTPGFFTGAIQFNSNREAAAGTIPVVSESEVPVSTTTPGHFTGTLTGGNGRATYYAQQLSYQFVVPPGVHDVDVDMTTANDGYFLLGNLVNPIGHAVDNQLSYQYVNYSDQANTHRLQLVWANPIPGTWKVDVENGLFDIAGLPVYSGLTQSTLSGTISFNTTKVSVTGMPSGTLTPGSTVTATVHVTNTGVEPEMYQLDPRTTAQGTVPAVSLTNPSGTLPVTAGTSTPQYVVPPFSTQLQVGASTTGSQPIMFDMSPYLGAPDVLAPPSTGGSTSVTVNLPITSEWGVAPDEVGPWTGSSTAPSENYSTSGTLTTLGFDPTANPSSGDIWDYFQNGAEAPNPLLLDPGQTGTMTVTFTVPSGTAGSTVAGEVEVETYNYTSFGVVSSDILAILPYSYKLGS